MVRRSCTVGVLLGLLACAPSDGPLSPEAVAQLHEAALVVDTHADTTPWFEDPEWRFS